jgi:hypothetical protein
MALRCGKEIDRREVQMPKQAWAFLVAMLLAPTPALAEPQGWGWLELRVPVNEGLHLRFVTEDNGYRVPGGGQLVYRAGPIWDLAPWASLALNVSAAADPAPGGLLAADYALELEPTFRTTLGPLQASYRNRLESRWLMAGHDWRDRHQLRFNWPLAGSPLMPFVWDELFWDLSGAGINQNRAVAGVGYTMNPRVRLDLGLMLRSNRASGADWTLDQVANVVLVYTP